MCDFSRLARKQPSLHHHLSVCQTLQLHTRQNPYLLKILRQFLLLFLEEFTPWLGTAAALGGTVAVVSPALSRPSPPANESSSAGRGGWSPGERTSAALPLPLPPSSPFQGKMESCFRPLHHNIKVYPENDPGSELCNNVGYYYSSGGDNDSNS